MCTVESFNSSCSLLICYAPLAETSHAIYIACRATVEGGTDTDTKQQRTTAGKKRKRKSATEESGSEPPPADEQHQGTSEAKSAAAAPASAAVSKRATRSTASAEHTQERGSRKRRKLQSGATAPEVPEQPEARQGQQAEDSVHTSRDSKSHSKQQLKGSSSTGTDPPLGQPAALQTVHSAHRQPLAGSDSGLQGRRQSLGTQQQQHLESGFKSPPASSRPVSTLEQSEGDCCPSSQSSDEASSDGETCRCNTSLLKVLIW